MGEEKFTAIIAGAGPAGSAAAFLLAREGVEVLLIERGATPGSKNMSGGRIYSHALNRIIPDFWEEAPVERPVIKETITFLAGNRAVSLDCHDQSWASPPYHSFTVLRAGFDAWLAARAEEAGAMLVNGIRVDDLLIKNGKVAGIIAGEDEMPADVVIAADGANSIIACKAGLRKKALAPHQMGAGAKQVIRLPAGAVSQRFGLSGNDGAARLFAGDCTKGMRGGGFLYTNKDSISLGLIAGADQLQKNKHRISDLLEEFKESPPIAPLIDGGEVVEYSAHLVPEAGLGMAPDLYSDGILVAGDAAGFVLNLGYMVRGMDFAIASGQAAAKAVLAANAAGDFSRQKLGVYQQYLKEDFVLRDLDAYRGAPFFLKNERVFRAYPQLVAEIAGKMFTVDGSPPEHLLGKLLSQVKKSGISWTRLAGDIWKGARNL